MGPSIGNFGSNLLISAAPTSLAPESQIRYRSKSCGEYLSSPQLVLYFLMKVSRSAVICSAFVVGMP
jgi:hypothetical protein